MGGREREEEGEGVLRDVREIVSRSLLPISRSLLSISRSLLSIIL